MRLTKQSKRDAKLLFRSSVVDGAPDETRVRKIVHDLLEKKPRGYLAALEYFRKLLELDQVRRTARIETPVALSPEEQEKVQENLRQHYGPGLTTLFVLNPSLIGGMRIQVGSDVYDGTIRGRLTQLQEAF